VLRPKIRVTISLKEKKQALNRNMRKKVAESEKVRGVKESKKALARKIKTSFFQEENFRYRTERNITVRYRHAN